MQTLDSNLSSIIILFAVSFGVLLIGVVVTYFWLVRKYLELQRKQSEINLEVNQQAQQLISDAQNKSQKIIEEANIKAGKIVSQAEAYDNRLENMVNQNLAQATQIYAKTYQESLQKTQDSIVKMLQNIPNDVKGSIVKEIDTFRTSLEQEAVKSKENIKSAITEVFQKAELDVESYKKMRQEQVDKTILEIVNEVAKKVIAKEISLEEHEKLVIKSLEEAKKQGIFK